MKNSLGYSATPLLHYTSVRIFTFLFIVCFSNLRPNLIIGQSDPYPAQCGMEAAEEVQAPNLVAPCSHTSLLWSNNVLFVPRSDARSIKVHANFIIVQKADGTGNFQDIPEHRAFLDEWLARCNETYTNLSGSSNCSPKISNVKIEIVPNWIFYPDQTEYYWNNDNNSGFGECPDLSNWWLEDLNDIILANYPPGINVYLTIDGSAYDEMILLQTSDQAEWDQYIWCSQQPDNNNLLRSTRIVANNYFLKYWWFQNHPEVIGVPFSVSRNWLLDEGVLLAHEFGHSFIDCYKPLAHKTGCDNHLMKAYCLGCGTYDVMLEDDAGCMHRNLSISNLRQFVDCDETDNTPNSILSDRIVLTNETWDLNIRLYSNIVVKTGATLTITCTVLMPEEGYIIVERGAKLIVNGGTIERANTCSAFQFWRGIAVQGNNTIPQPDPYGSQAANEAGIVFLEGHGMIEGSVVVTTNINPYQQFPSYWGGVVIADDFTFLDCRKGVEFMKYDFRNKSKFTNTHFIRSNTGSMHTGVSIWDTDKITFDECEFHNLTIAGIQSFDAGFEVGEKNVFTQNLYGIYTGGSTPLNGTVNIGLLGSLSEYRNRFEDNTCGIKGTSVTKMEIFSNDFKDFDFDIALCGYVTSRISDNLFEGAVVGNQFKNTSSRSNETLCNTYSGNLAGTNVIGQNTGYLFREEDFDVIEHDLFIEGTEANHGAIQMFQGGTGTARWNYFTSANSENIKTSTVVPNNFTDDFFYYHPNPSGNIRLKPLCPKNETCTPMSNFINRETGGISHTDCVFPNSPIELCDTKICLEQIREDLIQKENQFNINPSVDLEGEIQQLVTRREYIIDEIINDFVSDDKWDSVVYLLREDLNPLNRQRLIGSKIGQLQYDSALVLLQSYPVLSLNDSLFVQIQSLNIERLVNPEYNLTLEDESLLLDIASLDIPEAGYAQSLLGVIKNYHFMPSLPIMENENPFMAPYPHTQSFEEGLTVFPNPVNEILNVAIRMLGGENSDKNILLIQDINTGEHVRVYTVKELSNIKIPVDNLSSGMYVVKYVTNGSVITFNKFVVIH